jgi:hypothetical protein
MNLHILESRWTPECSESDCKGQISMVGGVIHIIENLLRHRCLKWVRMTHLDIWNTSYSQRKGRESKWQFDSRPLKVIRFPCVQASCDILLKRSWQGLQLCFRPHLKQRFAHKVMGPQSCRSPNFGNFGIPTWDSRDKKPFGCGFHGEAQNIL